MAPVNIITRRCSHLGTPLPELGTIDFRRPARIASPPPLD